MMEDVAIFWDYENCSAPANTSGYALVQSIRVMAQSYGSVKTLRAYLGITEQFMAPRTQILRSELQCSGVSLIDCPHNGRKDVADKMMIVDMLAHAIDNPCPSTIVLISGDRDFAYALSVLRLRCYRVILCTTSNAHLSLVSQASECIDWANLCASAVGVITPQWSIPNQPATPKIPPYQLDSQREGDASVSPFKASRELKEEDASMPPVREQKRSTVPFPSISSAPSVFGNPKSVVEFIPSSAKQCAPAFRWPITNGGSLKKSCANVDSPNSQLARQTLDMGGKLTLANDTILEMHTVASVGNVSSQDVCDSPSKSTLTFIDNDMRDDDNKQDPIAGTNYRNGYGASNEAPEPHRYAQTPRTSSDIPLPDFSLSSNPSNFFTPHLGPPFGIPASIQGYIPPQMDRPKPNIFGIPKPSTSPKKFKYSTGVPTHFVILIKVLQAQLQQGRKEVLRSQVGEQISHKGATYHKAGVSTFSEYVNMAQEAGIVELGGSDGKAWIALTSNWETIYVA